MADDVVALDGELVEHEVAADEPEVGRADGRRRLQRLADALLDVALLAAAERRAEHEQEDDPADDQAGCDDRRAQHH